MAVCVLVVAGVWRPLTAWLIDVPVPAVLLRPPAGEGGWQRSADIVAANWSPQHTGYVTQLNQSYRKAGDSVSLQVFYYAGQRTGHKLVQWNNRLVRGDGGPWQLLSENVDDMPVGARREIVRHALIKGAVEFQLWHWLWVDDRVTSSDSVAKIALLRERVTRSSDGSAAVLVATDAPPQRARAVVEDFLQHNAADIATMLKQAER